MKQFHLLLIGLLIASFGCSQAQEEKSNKPNAPKFEEGTENALLWQITGNGLKDTSYVFGTMHLINKEYFYFPDKLKTLIQSTDAVVLEIGEDLNDPFKAMKLMQLEGDRTIFDFFNEEQTDSILTWVEGNMGMNREKFTAAFGKMKPFILVSLGSEMNMAKCAESYEKTIMKIQKESKIKLEGLETIEEQLGIFDDMTDEEQAEMVMEAIRKDGESEKMILDMMKIYRRQNIDSLYLMIHEEGETIANKEDEFLSNRNHKWIPKINSMIADRRVFIAVGAGHLGGKEGVLNLLREEGYTITPLKL